VKILIQSPTDDTLFCLRLYGRALKTPSNCPWVASRVVMDRNRTVGQQIDREVSVQQMILEERQVFLARILALEG